MRHLLLRPYSTCSTVNRRERDHRYYNENRWTPAVDIYETDGEYVIYAEVPGISKDQLDIQLNSGTLTIKGEKKNREHEKEVIVHKCEVSPGEFNRSFNLPEDADAEKISAELKDGVLELKVGKAEEKKPRSVPITVH